MSVTILVQDISASVAVTEQIVTVDVGEQGPQGIPGPTGPAGGNFVFTQNTPASSWTIVHNLGLYPNVTVIEFGGAQVEGDLTYDSVNQLTLTFGVSISGTAYLS